MAKNIEMQYFNGSVYETVYPKTLGGNILMQDGQTLEQSIKNISSSSVKISSSTLNIYGETSLDGILNKLGKNFQYSWRRRQNGQIYKNIPPNSGGERICFNFKPKNSDGGPSVTIPYWNSITVNPTTGEVTGNGKSSVKLFISSDASAAYVFRGKWVAYSENPSGTGSEPYVYIDPSATITFEAGRFVNYMYIWASKGYKRNIQLVDVLGDWEYLYSENESTYPKNGIIDGYEYEFIGVVDKNIKMPLVSIYHGSYVGNGYYGSGNPISLSFDGKLKFFQVTGREKNGVYGPITQYNTISAYNYNNTYYNNFGLGSSSGNYGKISSDGKTLTWYGESSGGQLNDNGVRYHYCAFLQ